MSVITGSISINSSLQQSSPVAFGLPLPTQLNPSFKVASPPGTAGTANNADLKYSATLTLAATPTVLDLTNLTSPFGQTFAFVRIRSILIVNTSTTDGQVLKLGYSGTTSNAWTSLVSNPGQLIIPPSSTLNSGVFLTTAPNTTGWAVSSTNKLLQLDPGANSITVSIEILGCSA